MASRVGPAAVLFDMGGTLEEIFHEQESLWRGAVAIAKGLLRAGIVRKPPAPGHLVEQIEQGLVHYKRDMEHGTSCLELAPLEIWSRWLLRGEDFFPARLDEDTAEELSFLWETGCLRRRLRPEAQPVLNELARRGYRLGVVSNSIARSQVDYTLRLHHLEHFFATVQVSTLVGRRKPDPLMFQRAAAALGVEPGQCLHVGDTYDRDVLGARAAGLGYVLLISPAAGEIARAGEDVPDGPGRERSTWERRIDNLGAILSLLDEAPWRMRGGGLDGDAAC